MIEEEFDKRPWFNVRGYYSFNALIEAAVQHFPGTCFYLPGADGGWECVEIVFDGFYINKCNESETMQGWDGYTRYGPVTGKQQRNISFCHCMAHAGLPMGIYHEQRGHGPLHEALTRMLISGMHPDLITANPPSTYDADDPPSIPIMTKQMLNTPPKISFAGELPGAKPIFPGGKMPSLSRNARSIEKYLIEIRKLAGVDVKNPVLLGDSPTLDELDTVGTYHPNRPKEPILWWTRRIGSEQTIWDMVIKESFAVECYKDKVMGWEGNAGFLLSALMKGIFLFAMAV
ncbi:MAG: hypothetical protein LBC63_05810 [Holophagales bacterium]|jgi:hypothetical protein|nr:hypothetical protein [Holophagales bacterium]